MKRSNLLLLASFPAAFALCALRKRLDPIDKSISGIDVDAGIAVGQGGVGHGKPPARWGRPIEFARILTGHDASLFRMTLRPAT